MNRPLSYFALSLALLSTPALAQDAPATDVAPPEAAAPADAATPEAAVAVPEAPAASTAEAEDAPAPAPTTTETAAPEAAPTVDPTAAAADARVSAVPTGKAQIVFFRPWNYFGGAVSFTIKEGEAPVAKVTNGRYYIYVTDPGTHTYRVVSETTDTLTLELDAGETYYVKQTMDMGVILYRPNMAPSDGAAFAALPKLKLAKPPKVEQPKA